MQAPDAKEKITVTVFLCVCALWIFPELLKGIAPAAYAFFNGMGNSFPPMLGTIILCLIQIKGKSVLEFKSALSGISWISIFMAASALSIGSFMSNSEIGLTDYVINSISPLLSNVLPFGFAVLMVFFTGFLTNVASNMVIVVLACTIAIPIAMSMGSGINPAALAAVIGMSSAYAFATPPAMTTVALGLGSGWMTVGEMAKYGFIVLFGACVAISFIAYPIAAALM